MRLRAQILARFATVLVLFGAVVATSNVVNRLIREELVAATEYLFPLSEQFSLLGSAMFEYGLLVERSIDPDENPDAPLEPFASGAAHARTEIEDGLRETAALLDRAIQDSRVTVEGRLALARAEGRLALLQQSVNDLFQAGDRALAAHVAGRPVAANEALSQLPSFEREIAPGIESARVQLAMLEKSYVDRVYRHLFGLSTLGIVLFVLAAALGLGLGAQLAWRLVRRVGALHAGVQQVTAGDYSVSLPATSPDEVGDLTNEFGAMVGRLRDAASANEAFGSFFDPRIVDYVLRAGGGSAEYAERREVSVVFSDVADFSRLSESLTAEVMVKLLNRVFTEAATAIQGCGGIVDKFLGDGVMAFFMPPFTPGDSHAAAACRASLQIIAALERSAPEFASLMGLRRGAPNIEMRVGVCTGPVVIGTVGAPKTRSFTVMGDPVNAASRIGGVNKIYGTRLLVAEETWRLASPEMEGREIDQVRVVGKSESVRLFEIFGSADAHSAHDLERCETYAKALATYRAGDFAEAESGFAACVALDPDDGPAKHLLARVRELRRGTLPEGWDGVWYLDQK